MNSRRPKPRQQVSIHADIPKNKSNLALIDVPRSTRLIMDALPTGIILADREGIVTFASEAITTILQRKCLVGQPIELLVGALSLEHPSGRPFNNEELPLVKVIRQGRSPQPEQIIVTTPDGEKRLTRWNAIALDERDTQEIAAIGTVEDITETQESSLLSGEFFSMVVHELRTPLTAIKGHSQLLIRRPDYMAKREAMAESLQTIVEQADRLGGMISRLLDVSRAQMGTMELDRQDFDLIGLITSTVEDMQRGTDRHHLTYATTETELRGKWDRSYLQQVLVNLVENAIKYSPGGGEIAVSARAEGDRAVVSIQDQGMGMSPETLSQLFHRFYRSPQARGLGVRGLGVGLYITHQIVTAHDGYIWADSEPGQGSTFTFSLPLN